jgi:hypothetical protein
LIKKVEKTKKSGEFPEGLRFAFQYLYFKNDEWEQIARIDNFCHEGKFGTHIHILKRADVTWKSLSLREAEEQTIETGERFMNHSM